MSGSPYIRWAKSRERIRYNVGRSSIRPCPGELLAPRAEDWALHGAETAHGWPPLRQALADRYGVESGQVVLAIGASMANHLVCAALLEAGDHVLVESPVYDPLLRLPALFGARVEAFPRPAGDWRLDPDEVASRVRGETRLVVLSDLHNPSGSPAGAGALAALAELAEQRDFHVLVDEVYREFVHQPGAPVAANFGDRMVSTCSLTKAYGLDGLRAGWILAPAAVAERILHLNDLYGIIMPHPTERLALRALERLDVLRADVEALLERNRPRVRDFIDRRPELSWVAPEHGPVGFVRLRGGGTDELVTLLEERFDATLAPGRFFGRPDHFRIGFGMPTVELEEGLERLDAALDLRKNGETDG